MTDTATAALTSDNGGTPQGAQTTTQTTAPSWSEGLDEETRSYVTNKGWKEPTDILSSYRHLEKFAGGSKSLVEIPGENADEAARNAFYSRLGRPDAADKYEIKMPEGASPEMTEWFKGAAFKHGLTQKQAESLYTEFNGMTGTLGQQMQEQAARNSEAELKALKGEWGQAYDKMVDSGRRAVAALGYDQASLSALEEKMGTAEMMKMFAKVGSKMGEDEFVGDRGNTAGFNLTPADAKAQIDSLKLDKDFMGQYLKGIPEAVNKMRRLMEAAHGNP